MPWLIAIWNARNYIMIGGIILTVLGLYGANWWNGWQADRYKARAISAEAKNEAMEVSHAKDVELLSVSDADVYQRLLKDWCSDCSEDSYIGVCLPSPNP